MARQRGPKRPSTQCLMSQFPTRPNREFFEALQGIKSGDQGNFFPHQGIRSRPLLAFALTTNAIVPDRPRLCREGKEGAARCSKPPKPISRPKPAFVHVKGARHSRKFGRQVRRREQTAFRASRWRRRSCRALPDAPAPPKLRDRTPFGHAHDAAGCI